MRAQFVVVCFLLISTCSFSSVESFGQDEEKIELEKLPLVSSDSNSSSGHSSVVSSNLSFFLFEPSDEEKIETQNLSLVAPMEDKVDRCWNYCRDCIPITQIGCGTLFLAFAGTVAAQIGWLWPLRKVLIPKRKEKQELWKDMLEELILRNETRKRYPGNNALEWANDAWKKCGYNKYE